MKRISWKYMAGLVDGEGCIDFQVTKGKWIRPRVRLTLAGDDTLFLIRMLAENFGGHVNTKKNENSNWRTPHVWCLTGKAPVRAFLQNIFKHMYIKKEQAKFAIWWIDNMCGRHLSQEARKCAIEELKAMKRDAQRLSEKAARNCLSA